MRNYSYSKESFFLHRGKDDKRRYGISSDADFQSAVDTVYARIKGSAPLFDLHNFKKNGRSLYKPKNFETALILRKLEADLKSLTPALSQNRPDIIQSIRNVCQDSTPSTIIRLDIKKFYESVSLEDVRKTVLPRLANTYMLQRTLDRFIGCVPGSAVGLPTGISLSASLAELYLKYAFDDKIRAVDGVYFYKRYVDDIILFSAQHPLSKDVVSEVQSLLPHGLSFNQSKDKKKVITTAESGKHYNFSYLGYSFDVKRSGDEKKVTLDISSGKIDKRITKYCKAYHTLLSDANLDDFKNRFLYLNSGHRYYDDIKGSTISSGICNTYSELSFPSASLKRLQNFYRYSVLSRSFPMQHRLRHSHLHNDVRRWVLQLDLEKHVKEKKHFNFSHDEITHMARCWRNV